MERARRSRATRRGARFEAEGEPYKVELVDTAEGRSASTRSRTTAAASSPTSAAARTSRTRRRSRRSSSPASRARTGAATSSNTQLTRIYGTAFYSQADLDAHLERLEEARARDHRRLGAQLDLFHLSEHSPGSPFWHPKGMVIWNALEDLRRRENARRGYVEVKTPLLYDTDALRDLGPLRELPRRTCSWSRATRSTTDASRSSR